VSSTHWPRRMARLAAVSVLAAALLPVDAPGGQERASFVEAAAPDVATGESLLDKITSIMDELDRPPMRASRAERGPWLSTSASWYDEGPAGCYDADGFHKHPGGDLWTAHKSLPCGTQVQVKGPAGTITVPVLDRGPYVSGRDLDLTPSAFVAVCEAISRGVCRVEYREVGGWK